MAGWGVPEQGWKKGPWIPEEDKLLIQYVSRHGEGRWSSVSRCSGLNRSGKSCRLRWVNYLRPGLKRGHITPQEEGIIIQLHALWGNKWSTIARYLPGRTDNEIKNYWRTHFKKTRRPNQTQEKKKNLNQKQVNQQEEQSGGKNPMQEDPTSDININEPPSNNNQETITNDPTIPDKQILPIMYNQDITSLPDCIALDDYLWGDIWNLNFS